MQMRVYGTKKLAGSLLDGRDCFRDHELVET